MSPVTIKNLSFSYNGNVDVIKDISLDIDKGLYVSFLGHNGSGKSTLAKLIVGLLEPNKGEILISGLPLNKTNINTIRNQVAIVFQNPDNQFIGATVEDDIAFSLENRCVERSEMHLLVKEYAEKVGISKYLDKEPAFLSGGQKQRVAIAGALVIKPNILVLDEATSMLDPQGKREVFEIIDKMRKENPDLTIISITHDVEEAFTSDRIVLLDQGSVVAYDTPENLFSNDDLVNKYSLKLPFIFQLHKKLADKQIYCDTNLKEMEDALCQLK